MKEPTEEEIEAIGKAGTREELAELLKDIDPVILAQAGIV